jgi:hypothetical protein
VVHTLADYEVATSRPTHEVQSSKRLHGRFTAPSNCFNSYFGVSSLGEVLARAYCACNGWAWYGFLVPSRRTRSKGLPVGGSFLISPNHALRSCMTPSQMLMQNGDNKRLDLRPSVCSCRLYRP